MKIDVSRKRYKQQRNLSYQPFIDGEGEFLKPLPRPPTAPNADRLWYVGLPPHVRLNFHQTLNSTRRYAGFRKFPNKVPADSLDLVLQSQYQHNLELFADKVDIVLQPETVGRQTFRRIRNTKDLTFERVIPIGHPLIVGKLTASSDYWIRCLNFDLLLLFFFVSGGIQDRISPHSVKLMCSGPHSSQTNPGYSRQTGDGNVFNY